MEVVCFFLMATSAIMEIKAIGSKIFQMVADMKQMDEKISNLQNHVAYYRETKHHLGEFSKCAIMVDE